MTSKRTMTGLCVSPEPKPRRNSIPIPVTLELLPGAGTDVLKAALVSILTGFTPGAPRVQRVSILTQPEDQVQSSSLNCYEEILAQEGEVR